MTNDSDYNNEMSSHLSSWIYSSNNLMIIYINFSMTSKQPDTKPHSNFRCDLYLNIMLISNIGLKEVCKRTPGKNDQFSQ